MRRSGNAGRGSASARNEDGLMPIVPVSLPDSQAPPPDESVGPIPVGPQCRARWGRKVLPWGRKVLCTVLPWGHLHCCGDDTRADTPNALLPHSREPHCNFVVLSSLAANATEGMD